MNKSLTPTEVKDLLTTVKHPSPPPRMSRFDRMMIWAAAVAAHPRQLSMFHGLEHISHHRLGDVYINGETIFDLGHKEPRLAEQGLSSNNLLANMNFFELSHDELHYLSCDCHGEVPNDMVANRIATLAAMKPGQYYEPPRHTMTVILSDGVSRVS